MPGPLPEARSTRFAARVLSTEHEAAPFDQGAGLFGERFPPARDGSAARPLARGEIACLFGLGFALQFNVLLSTFGLPFQRLSDLLPFLLIPFFARRGEVWRTALQHGGRIALIVGALAASIVLKSEKSNGDVYLSLVLLLYFVQCIELVVLFRDGRWTAAFCWGILAGLPGALAVLMAQSAGMDLASVGLGVPTDLQDPEAVLFAMDKLGGIWNAGNETGHVFAATGAAALFLAHYHRRVSIYLLFFAGLVVSFPLTNNRAGLIMPALVLVPLLWRHINLRVVLAALGAVAVWMMIFSATDEALVPDGLRVAIEKRFANDAHVESNASERIDSNLGTLQLIAANPFGLGVVAKQEQLKLNTGLETSHNGILSLALQSGVSVALLFLLGAVTILVKRWRFGDFAPSVVLFMLPSLVFEDLSVNQFLLFLMGFVLANWSLGTPEP